MVITVMRTVLTTNIYLYKLPNNPQNADDGASAIFVHLVPQPSLNLNQRNQVCNTATRSCSELSGEKNESLYVSNDSQSRTVNFNMPEEVQDQNSQHAANKSYSDVMRPYKTQFTTGDLEEWIQRDVENEMLCWEFHTRQVSRHRFGRGSMRKKFRAAIENASDKRIVVDPVYCPLYQLEIYGENVIFEEKYRNIMHESEKGEAEMEEFFENSFSDTFKELNIIRKSYNVKLLKKLSRITEFSLKDHSKILSCFMNMYRKGAAGSCIKSYEIWYQLTRFIDPIKHGENRFVAITKDPRITCFYLSLASYYWSLDDLRALMNRVNFGIRNQRIKNGATSVDAMMDNAKKYFTNSIRSNQAYHPLIQTVCHLNMVLAHQTFQNRIIQNACISLNTPNAIILFIARFNAFISHYFIGSFNQMLGKILSLKNNDIHKPYLNVLEALLERLDGSIIGVFRTNSTNATLLEILRSKELDEKILTESFCRLMVSKIKFLNDKWCSVLEKSTNKIDIVKQHMIANFLNTFANMVRGIHVLLLGLRSDENVPNNYNALLNGTTFENIVFDSFDPEKTTLFVKLLHSKLINNIDISVSEFCKRVMARAGLTALN